jgi:radical SAM-linked protein
MGKIRCRYTKTGKAKYISHLDLMATMQRVYLRAGVKLKYSEGFNPHPYMSVALPLPVGCESLCELMDIEVVDESLPPEINRFLPEGLDIVDIYLPARKFNVIKWVAINCQLHYDDLPDDIIDLLHKRFTATSLVIPKKSKSGVSDVDVAPFIRDVKINGKQIIELSAKVSAQNPTISQNDLLSVIRKNEDIPLPDYFEIKRIDIYDESMVEFR